MSLRDESYLVGLIGDGITHSVTPPLHENAADRAGLRYVYRPVDLATGHYRKGDLAALLNAGRALGFSAFNITYPFKQDIIALLDEVAPEAARLRSVNTVIYRDGRWYGTTTDTSGFVLGLSRHLPDADLSHVVQLGAGGAGAAVADGLLQRGTAQLSIVDVDAARAGSLAESLSQHYPNQGVSACTPDGVPALLTARGGTAVTGLLNASPIGMHHHPGSPLDLELLHPGLWVGDCVYLPLETPLITTARSIGAQVLDGGAMAVGQAVEAFRLITGITPDIDAMQETFRARIARLQPQGECA